MGPRRRQPADDDKSLASYEAKRDFDATPEPAPAERGRRRGDPVFVVHRHDARNLHYDLRLEWNGALCSWAVPRGLSLDPTVKRLAVRTEDHPLEYETFDGVIPKGQYGAGTMTLWDRGRITYLGPGATFQDGLDEGKLEFVLRGRRLRAEWHLVKTQQDDDSWLLLKARDGRERNDDDPSWTVDFGAATRSPPPRTRMKATSERPPFSDDQWLFEVELEGAFTRVVKRGDTISLNDGQGDDLGSRLPELRSSLRQLRARDAALDGVLVALDDEERPSRACLEAWRSGRAPETPLCLYIHDVVQLEEWNICALPLHARKRVVQSLVPTLPRVLIADAVETEGIALVQAVRHAGLGHVLAKRADSPYRTGRSKEWVRLTIEDGDDAQGRASRGGVREALESRAADLQATRRRIRFTRLDKELWPGEGLTKRHLVAHYERVAEVLLPYLRDRPLHLHRFPDGIEAESFYQKNTPAHFPSWIRTESIPSQHGEKEIRYTVCQDTSTLLYLANTGSIDLHPWLSRLDHLDQPDWMVIDLDPKGAPFTDVVRIARTVGKLLSGIGLTSFLKTSGSTGLHVLVRFTPAFDYEPVRLFAEGVARCVVREHPDIATVERHVASRAGKVYIDYLQNRRGQTVVPPYVPRPVPGGRVSCPLAWDELSSALDPSEWTVQTFGARLDRVGDLMKPSQHASHDLAQAVSALDRLLRDG